eukprot:gnl/Spiro4/28220_TR13966_c0_g2_i1.p1 gnl/Spiro4/28220_TR13966_c0_g2~~gnl/Spiro4/28220_TR13966_c0_g2_i1.p1  ORF type:complete len:266 (+),score=29.58 gnl/Spiro4/28220_TR13966_c0_g2_i1:118-915(+)
MSRALARLQQLRDSLSTSCLRGLLTARGCGDNHQLSFSVSEQALTQGALSTEFESAKLILALRLILAFTSLGTALSCWQLLRVAAKRRRRGVEIARVHHFSILEPLLSTLVLAGFSGLYTQAKRSILTRLADYEEELLLQNAMANTLTALRAGDGHIEPAIRDAILKDLQGTVRIVLTAIDAHLCRADVVAYNSKNAEVARVHTLLPFAADQAHTPLQLTTDQAHTPLQLTTDQARTLLQATTNQPASLAPLPSSGAEPAHDPTS